VAGPEHVSFFDSTAYRYPISWQFFDRYLHGLNDRSSTQDFHLERTAREQNSQSDYRGSDVRHSAIKEGYSIAQNGANSTNVIFFLLFAAFGVRRLLVHNKLSK
jgi:hypothetical protein